MAAETLVSIIVPVYKVEKYLRQCVESVLAQTYSCWELILVDDGSPDSSGRIADEFARRDSRVRVIHQKNAGPSAARNAGLDSANGELITFIDSDDIISPEYLSALLMMLQTTGADIATVAQSRFSAVPAPGRFVASQVKVLRAEKAVERMLYQTGEPNASAASKLYRRRLLDDFRFREGIYYEDLDIAYRLMLKARKVAVAPARLYYYRRTPGSILSEFRRERLDVLDVTARMEPWLRKNGHAALIKAARSRVLSAAFNMFCLLKRNDPTLSQASNRCWLTITAYRGECLLNPKVRLKNKLGILASYLGGRRLVGLLSRFLY